MKKMIVFGAAAAALAFTGCRMCIDPIPGDATCIENSHFMETTVMPKAMTRVSPNLAGSLELFRPVFKAGTQRITVVGEGTSRGGARQDAIAKFLAKANCDYIVSVSSVVVEKAHPTWRLFTTSNYAYTLSGIPIHLEKLSVEKISPEKADQNLPKDDCEENKGISALSGFMPPAPVLPTPAAAPAKPATDANCGCPTSMIKLSDIRVNITANGSTDDKAGVIFPVK